MEALIPPTAGTAAAPIWFNGYTTTPGDGGLATVDGNGGALATGIKYTASPQFHVWTNFRITDFSGHGVDTSNGSKITFRFCEMDNNAGTAGIQTGIDCDIVSCYVHNNSGYGIFTSVNNRVVGCTISNNLGIAGVVVSGGGGIVVGNTIDGNNGDGIQLSSSPATCIGNTVYGNSLVTDVGINVVSVVRAIMIVNNIITECGIGIKHNNTNPYYNKVPVLHNLLFNNTTDYSDAATDLGELTVDPLFLNQESGDFTLDQLSPARNVGAFPSKAPGAPSQVAEGYYLGSTPNKIPIVHSEDRDLATQSHLY